MYEDDSGSSMQELESRPKRMLVAIAECSMSDLSNFISFGLPVEPEVLAVIYSVSVSSQLRMKLSISSCISGGILS